MKSPYAIVAIDLHLRLARVLGIRVRLAHALRDDENFTFAEVVARAAEAHDVCRVTRKARGLSDGGSPNAVLTSCTPLKTLIFLASFAKIKSLRLRTEKILPRRLASVWLGRTSAQSESSLATSATASLRLLARKSSSILRAFGPARFSRRCNASSLLDGGLLRPANFDAMNLSNF